MTTLCQADWVESRAEREIRLSQPGLPAEPEWPVRYRYVPAADYPRQPIPFRGDRPPPKQEPSR